MPAKVYTDSAADLGVFKNKITNQDPAGNPSFLLITQTSV